jgi:hypothetical protein
LVEYNKEDEHEEIEQEHETTELLEEVEPDEPDFFPPFLSNLTLDSVQECSSIIILQKQCKSLLQQSTTQSTSKRKMNYKENKIGNYI